MQPLPLDRRSLLRYGLFGGGGLALAAALPAWARSGTPGLAAPMAVVSGEDIRLEVGPVKVGVGGRAHT